MEISKCFFKLSCDVFAIGVDSYPCLRDLYFFYERVKVKQRVEEDSGCLPFY